MYISEQNNAVKLLSSREVEGNGPMKPGNPLCNVAQQGANSGEALYALRKMRGIRDDASPLLKWGFFVTVSAFSILQAPYKLIANYCEEEE